MRIFFGNLFCKSVLTCVGLSVLMMALSKTANGQIIEWQSTGSGFWTGGNIFELNVVNPLGVRVSEFSYQLRGDEATRSYAVWHRVGAHDEVIDELPVHRIEEEWTQIATAEDLSFTSTTAHPFAVDLTLAAGLHSIYFATTASTGSNNGLRSTEVDNIGTGDVFAFDSNLELVVAGSKGSAFGTTIPANNGRTPGNLTIQYQVIPEPSTGIILLGLTLVGCLSRRRLQR